MRKMILAAIFVALLVWTGAAYAAPPADGPPGLAKAVAAQMKHNPQLLTTPGVVGTAVALEGDGLAVVKVFTERPAIAQVPLFLDDVPVVVQVTGKMVALGAKPPSKRNTAQTKTTDYWTRPVPIGVSTGNYQDVSAGTIACRVVDSADNVYALSNTHVFAPNDISGSSEVEDTVTQPGLYDAPDNAYDSGLDLGQVTAYKPINGSIFVTNDIDAAIARTDVNTLGTSTPTSLGGYGVPNKTPRAAALNMRVQKFGRTTLLTKGTITGINATMAVGYADNWSALFSGQIIVETPRAFVLPGDSGSLVVTDDANANPVGLLFAGNANGTMAIVNPINKVLAYFQVTIDGK